MQSSSRLVLIRQWVLWVIIQRWMAGVGLILALAASRYWLGFPLNYAVLWALSAFLFLYNACFYLLAHGRGGFTYLTGKPERFIPFAFTQIYLDLFFLTLLLHFGGGAENPFVLFYVFHVAISSILFTRKRAYLNALLAGLLINLLFWAEYSGLLFHYHLSGLVPPGLSQNGFYLVSLGGVLSFTLLAAAYMAGFLVEQLRQREAEVQDLHREKSEFMRKAAHELRAPLSAIQSCLQVILELFGEQLSGKPRELIERAERRSGGLIALVRDLLNLSRAEEVLQWTSFESLDLREILEGVIELIKPDAQRKQIQIESQLGEENLSFKGDKGGLEEVFTNLLSNAVKYSPPDTQVQVRVETNPQEIEIAFSDQGIGIPAEDMELLFSEFFRSGNAKAMQVEGTGLGLALSKKIVEIHGGEIKVESELDKGSCFKVKLPR